MTKKASQKPINQGQPPARVTVRLTNLFDELAARERKLARSRIRSVRVEADVDGEPVWSVIPRRVARQLGLRVHRAWNGWQVPGVVFKLLNRTTSEGALVGGRKVLVGRTVLMGTDLNGA